MTSTQSDFPSFTRVIKPCFVKGWVGNKETSIPLYCKVSWNGVRLSIAGVEGPLPNGNAHGSCGQCIPDMLANPTLGPGWTRLMLMQFVEIWKTHHLNDVNAGSPTQKEYLKLAELNRSADDHRSHYDWASQVLESAGLNPDPEYLHNGRPYRYGSAWLKETVPLDALQFLNSLPESDTTPAWV